MLIKLWQNLSKRRQKQSFLILATMIISSFFEVLSIGALLPFIGILTVPEQIYHHNLLKPVIDYFGMASPKQLILPITISFILLVIFAASIRLLLLYAITRLSFATGADFSVNIYRRTLYQDYPVHLARNSSEVINGIINKTEMVVGGVINPILTLTSSMFLMVGIIVTLFAINFLVALSVSVCFVLLYWLVIRHNRNQLAENSKCIAHQSTQMLKSLQEGLGGIRDILIDGNQQYFCQIYRRADLPYRIASGNNIFIGGSPRYVMETVGMTIIAILAYIMTQKDPGLTNSIPVLGAFAMGAQRLLPAFQQAYSAYSIVKGSKSSFEDVLELLEQPLPGYADNPTQTSLIFEKEIQFKNLCFRYAKNKPWVLKDVELKIRKGERIGFIGETGAGKSTTIDIILGLLHQTSGEFTVDGQSINAENKREWQVHIAHVPQNIFLSDNTIEENIAFGIPKEKINHQNVEKAAQQAQISDLIKSLPEGYQTIIGERGTSLSGGQQQRIGIARALYKNADVLILDEATSSLDNNTEQAVMESIKRLGRDLTILIIAHRLTTLKNCDRIVKIEGEKAYIKNFQDIMSAEN